MPLDALTVSQQVRQMGELLITRRAEEENRLKLARRLVDKAILLMLPRAVADPAGTLKRGSKKARKQGRKKTKDAGKSMRKATKSAKEPLEPVKKSGKRLRKKTRSLVE